MTKQILIVSAVMAIILTMVYPALAEVPQLISFQGKLYDDAGNPLTGEYEITFRIYDVETGGTGLWSETITVDCDNGLYNVILGQTTELSLDFEGQYWLGVQVTGDDELSPRYRLVSVPTAFRAQVANQVSWTNLTDIPEGFADGTDDVGAAGGVSQIEAGTGIGVTNPTGPTATVSADIGTGENQVAAGDHNHDTDYVNEGETNSITSGMIVNGTIEEDDLSFTPGGGDGHSLDAADGSPTDALYVDNSGNVGIGETSPTSNLHVTGSSGNPTVRAINNGSGKAVWFENSTSGNYGYLGGSISGVRGEHFSSGNYGYLGSSSFGVYGYSGSGWAGYFAGKTYMEGNVGIGTEDPTSKLHVTGSSDDPILDVTNNGSGKGVYGQSNSGIGVYGKNQSSGNFGYLGDNIVGVYGEHKDGHNYGYLGGSNAGVRGSHSGSGNWGDLGNSISGVFGASSVGWAGYFEGKTYMGGDVGIGTDSPGYTLDVAGPVNLNKGITGGEALRVNGDEAIWYNGTYFSWGYGGTSNYFQDNVGIGVTSPATKLHVSGAENNGTTATLKITSGSQNMLIDGNEIDAFEPGLYLNNNSSLRVILATGGGNVGIGLTNPLEKLDVNGNIRADNIAGPSDVRLKKEIQTIQNALEKVTSISGVNFKWKNEEKSKDFQLGVIAQDVEKVFPEAVLTDDEGYKSVVYGRLVAPLIEAVKELKEENVELRMEIDELRKLMNK